MSTHALPSRVDGDEVRRVRLGACGIVERADERRQHAIRFSSLRNVGNRPSAAGTPDRPSRLRKRSPSHAVAAGSCQLPR